MPEFVRVMLFAGQQTEPIYNRKQEISLSLPENVKKSVFLPEFKNILMPQAMIYFLPRNSLAFL